MRVAIIIGIIFLLNLVGLGLHAYYCKKSDTAFTWYEAIYMMLCGVTYIPMAIIELVRLNKK